MHDRPPTHTRRALLIYFFNAGDIAMASFVRHAQLFFFVALLMSMAPSHALRSAQHPAESAGAQTIDTSALMDCARHWWSIHDEEHIIEPLPNQQKYPATAITAIADNMLLYQKKNGGWPKNYDMQAILTDEQKAVLKSAEGMTNTTIDNGATHSHIQYLAQAFTITHDARYSTAALRGIRFLLSAQYANGGWPQFFPEKKGYARYITFNDGAMIGVMEVLHAIVRGDSTYAFVGQAERAKVAKAFAKGLECILECQIKEKGELSVWCQQHDDVTLLPQKARTFEPASICNQESADIVEFLMSINNPSPRIITAVEAAVTWFEASRIYNIRVKTIPAPTVKFQYHTSSNDRIVVVDSTAPPIWTRFTELRTHRPLFSSRNWKIVYSLAEVERERRTGYGWYTYAPEKILDSYPQWAEKFHPEARNGKK
jgi:PelA/Pel-15E family pectate lyase